MDIGRKLKDTTITFRSIKAIFKYLGNNIKSKNKNKNGTLKIDKTNIKGTIEYINNSTDIIIKIGTEEALVKLKDIYIDTCEKILKIDKSVLKIHSKEEFNGIKENLKNEYKRILNQCQKSINHTLKNIKENWERPSDINKIKQECTKYIDTVFNINNNNIYYRSMDKEEFMKKFKFDASKVFELYQTIKYDNLNKIPEFLNILNNIKIT